MKGVYDIGRTIDSRALNRSESESKNVKWTPIIVCGRSCCSSPCLKTHALSLFAFFFLFIIFYHCIYLSFYYICLPTYLCLHTYVYQPTYASIPPSTNLPIPTNQPTYPFQPTNPYQPTYLSLPTYLPIPTNQYPTMSFFSLLNVVVVVRLSSI